MELFFENLYIFGKNYSQFSFHNNPTRISSQKVDLKSTGLKFYEKAKLRISFIRDWK